VRMYPLMYDRLELLDESGQEQAKSDDPTARSQRTRAAQAMWSASPVRPWWSPPATARIVSIRWCHPALVR